jgi:sugar-specific transcriptional regulator TrmB
MIVKEEFLSKLRRYFSLNLYEVKVWAALLSRGVSTAGELSDIANVPRSRSYDVLESLEKKGFIIMKLGKPIKYIAVSPEEVLERVKKKIKEDSDRQSDVINELKDSEVIKELNVLHSKGVEMVDPVDLTGVIKGRTNLLNHLESMIKIAKKSVSIITTEDGLIRKSESLKGSFKRAKENGAKIKIIAPVTKKSIKFVKDLEEFAQVKSIDSINARFCIVDSKNLIFMLLGDKETHPSYDVGIWVNTEFFSNALEGIFGTVWETLKPLEKTIKN